MGRTGLVAMILVATALVGSCSTALPHAAAPPSTNSASPAADSTPPPSPTRRKAAEIYSTTRDAVLAIQVQDGSRRALDALSLLAQRELGVSGACHAISHDLGHAALEQALAESADPQAAMLTVCAPMQDGSCWHGVGHGLMFGERVFMQLFSADRAADHAAARKVCQSTRSPHDAQCWFDSPVVWLTVHPDGQVPPGRPEHWRSDMRQGPGPQTMPLRHHMSSALGAPSP